MPSPPALPENYDAQAHMITHQVRGRIFHATIPSAQLASELMASGAPAAIAEAAAIFRAVLACQEVRDTQPHRGNFRWELEDEVVEDLNAVQFVLFYCIPVLCKTSDALPPDLVAAMRRAVALGLEEVARIDVALAYTNIVLKDIANSCLGGQLLGDDTVGQRGREKLVRWMAHVDTYGLPAEYNSPNYASVAVRVLGRLAELTEDEHTRIRARTMLARLGLSAALHVHPGIGCWAGPFSRAYSHAVFNANAFNADDVRAWLDGGQVPAWIGDLLQRPNAPQQIDETAHGEEPVALSTYHSPSFSLGVASCELKTQEVIFIALQSSVFHAQYRLSDSARCGVLFSRYILDDQWLSFQTTPSRAPGQVVPEEGHFYGVHERGRAIGLYAPRGLERLDAAHQRQSRARVDRDRAGRRDLDWPAQSRFSAGGSAPGRGGRRRQRCSVDGRPAARTDRSGRRCPHPLGRTGRSSGLGDVQLYGTGQDVLGNGQTRLLLPGPAPLRFLRRTGRAH